MRRLVFLILVLFSFSCSRKVNTSQTAQTPVSIIKDSLPLSEIDIPIQIDLKSLTSLAEKNVDTVFTSPNWPNDWVNADCATRYKYYFRRSLLRITGNANNFNLSFTGFYKIIGSTRVCVGNTVVSPWTPECKCGFNEGERKVNIGFNGSFLLQPNYQLQLKILRNEPEALNKCTVCFWGQDITGQVMDGLKKELDLSKKTIQDSFGVTNLRPHMQQLWNKLNEVFATPGLGYFSLQPKKIRMENIKATNDLLSINVGITATPIISFQKPSTQSSPVPDLSPGTNNGFNIHLDAALQYDSLSKVVNDFLVGKRFDFAEGILKKHVIVQNCKLYGNENEQLMIEVDFKGSFDGKAYFVGKPVYNSAQKSIEVQNLDFDLRTKSLLLKTAKWLFDKRITAELKKYTSFNMVTYYDTASKTLNAWLNKEWAKGIKGSGNVRELKLTGIYALPQHLLIRSNCSGSLMIKVNELNFAL